MDRTNIGQTKGYKITPQFSIAPYNNIKFEIFIMEDKSQSVLDELNSIFPEAEFTGEEYAFVYKYQNQLNQKTMMIGFNLAYRPEGTVDVDVIAHESVHAKNMILQNIRNDNPIDFRQDEHEAYLVGYLTHIIFDFFQRTGNLDKINFNYNEQHY